MRSAIALVLALLLTGCLGNFPQDESLEPVTDPESSLGSAAATSETPYVHEGSIEIFPSVYGFQSAQNFHVELKSGDVVHATLQWSDDLTDLDLLLIVPGDSCDVDPSIIGCAAGSAAGRAECKKGPRGGAPADFAGVESWTWTIERDAEWAVSVLGAFTASRGSVPYLLTVEIVGSQPSSALHLGEELIYVSPSQHCRVG